MKTCSNTRNGSQKASRKASKVSFEGSKAVSWPGTRLQDWGDLWGIRADNDPHPRTSLKHEAQAQAQAIEPLTTGHLTSVLKGAPDKASGPDAVSTQLLKAAPPLSLAPLLQLYHTMEEQAELPTQMQMHMVVMLPKNQNIERPITLTSTGEHGAGSESPC